MASRKVRRSVKRIEKELELRSMRLSTSYFGKKSQILNEKQTRESNPIDDKNLSNLE